MKINRLLLLGMVLAGLAVYASCRKIDYHPHEEKKKVNSNEKFFTSHPSSNPVVQSVVSFMASKNEKEHFVKLQ